MDGGGLPSGWNFYYIIVLAGGLALLIPLALFAISRTLSPKPASPVAPAPQTPLIRSDNPAEIGRKSNPRFFQATNAAMLLVVLALLMVPCAVSLPEGASLVLILTFSALAGLGLFYGVRKQDLDWLKSFRGDRE